MRYHYPRHIVVDCGPDHGSLWFLTESNVVDPLSEPLSGDAQHPSKRDEYMQAQENPSKGQ
jgi:hypothetical protein